MRIGLDVMGGDNAPDAILQGAMDALDRLAPTDVLVLVGDSAVIERALSDRGVDDGRVTIVPAAKVIAMDESPVEAVRGKRDSSLVALARMTGRQANRPNMTSRMPKRPSAHRAFHHLSAWVKSTWSCC